MLRWLRHRKEEPTVSFCDRCARVCDARCSTSCAWDRAIEDVRPLRVTV